MKIGQKRKMVLFICLTITKGGKKQKSENEFPKNPNSLNFYLFLFNFDRQKSHC